RASRERPLALLIEDLHWADESSLDLLAFIAGQLGTQRLVILGTFRSDELTRAHPLIARLGELVRLAHTARLDLQGFNRDEVEDQLTGILGRRPSTSMLDAALMRSDGNPFHVEELAREGPDGRMSTTLREALQARLARLSPAARRGVFAVAGIGRVATQELIEAVIDDRPEELGGALGEALEHSILVQADDGTGYAFRHALVQAAAADGLLPSERVLLHRKIVAALQAGGGASGEIARHAMLAHDAPTALAWSVKAADDAIAVVAFSEALAHVDRALELWPAVAAADRVAGCDLGSMLVLASDCAGALGLWARAADLGRAAVATLDPVERPEARASALLD